MTKSNRKRHLAKMQRDRLRQLKEGRARSMRTLRSQRQKPGEAGWIISRGKSRNPAGLLVAFSQVCGSNWCQETYETTSRDARQRAQELRKAGWKVNVFPLGHQVTHLGSMLLTMVDIRHKDSRPFSVSELPPVRVSQRTNPTDTRELIYSNRNEAEQIAAAFRRLGQKPRIEQRKDSEGPYWVVVLAGKGNPVRIHRLKSGRYRVKSGKRLKAAATTHLRALRQASLIRGVKSGRWKPTGKPARDVRRKVNALKGSHTMAFRKKRRWTIIRGSMKAGRFRVLQKGLTEKAVRQWAKANKHRIKSL